MCFFFGYWFIKPFFSGQDNKLSWLQKWPGKSFSKKGLITGRIAVALNDCAKIFCKIDPSKCGSFLGQNGKKAVFLSFRNDGVDHLLFWLMKFVPVDELIYLNISVILCWLLFHFRWLLTPFGQGLLAMICYALSRQSLYYIFFSPYFFGYILNWPFLFMFWLFFHFHERFPRTF